MQSAASVEDQLRLLRQRARREGWTVAAEHADRAISGTVRDRPGLVAAVAAIERGEADVLAAESLDRLSRDQEDLAGLFKRVRFHGARIVTLSEGEIGTLHIGMGGTMAALFLEQLAEKTRRGQIGRVEAGRIPGGISYGYRRVVRLAANGEPERGLREIDAAEAAVVVRIFTAYAAGESPLDLARALNREGVPSPRGGLWRASTIVGHRQRRNGILNNELYRGRILYNRQSFRKDPETRRRIARANAEEERVAHDVPELRVVDEALWQAVQDRLARYGARPPHQARRPRRLLSGLMRCGDCGGPVILVDVGRWGCSNHRQTGTCAMGATIMDTVAQRRIWAAIRHHLLHPEVVAAYLDELRLAAAETRRTAIAGRARIERRLAELDREDQRITAAIAAGLPIESLKARALALAAEREQLRDELAAAHDDPQAAALIHPGVAEHFKRKVEALHQLADGDAELRRHGRALLEELLDKIVVTRAESGRGAALALHGNLAALLQIPAPDAQKPAAPESGGPCGLKMVAGVGFGRHPTFSVAA